MSNINSVTLTGHLTHDPTLRTLESGTKACSMRIAVDGRRPTADGWSRPSTTSASPSSASRARPAIATSPRAGPSRSKAA